MSTPCVIHPGGSGKYKLSSGTWKWDFFRPTLPLTPKCWGKELHKEACPLPKRDGTELGDSTLKNKWESETIEFRRHVSKS